jgi:hypothetical protein
MVDWLTDFVSFFKEVILLTLQTPSMLIVIIGLFLTGLLFGQWWLMLFPAALQSLAILGVGMGWWGHGLGEDWQVGSIIFALIGVATVALGLLSHRLLHHAPLRGAAPRRDVERTA